MSGEKGNEKMGRVNTRQARETYDTTWQVEITVDMLVHINNESSQYRVYKNWEEDRCEFISESGLAAI